MNDNTPVSSLRRFPAEWERHDCVLLAWPHEDTDWNYILDDARRCIGEIVRVISQEECVMLVGPADLCLPSIREQGFDSRRVRFVDMETNDTWARDFGALTVEVDGSLYLLDFKFNGWGLKFAADRDNLITSKLDGLGMFACDVENRLNFVLEGGSVESDGRRDFADHCRMPFVSKPKRRMGTRGNFRLSFTRIRLYPSALPASLGRCLATIPTVILTHLLVLHHPTPFFIAVRVSLTIQIMMSW